MTKAMKRSITILSVLITSGAALLLSSCATGSGDAGTTSYENPDPLQQQVQMQEQMSRVTRTLTPF